MQEPMSTLKFTLDFHGNGLFQMNFLLAGAVAALMTLATSASALTYNWSFLSTNGTSNGLVTGTISGLQIGSNIGSGLTVSVLSTPSGNVLGGGWTFIGTGNSNGGDAFTVDINKSVTFADAGFRRDNNHDWINFGRFGAPNGYRPEIYSQNENDGLFGPGYTSHITSGSMVFNLVPAVVPLPASLPLMLVGLGGLVALRRRSKFFQFV